MRKIILCTLLCSITFFLVNVSHATVKSWKTAQSHDSTVSIRHVFNHNYYSRAYFRALEFESNILADIASELRSNGEINSDKRLLFSIIDPVVASGDSEDMIIYSTSEQCSTSQHYLDKELQQEPCYSISIVSPPLQKLHDTLAVALLGITTLDTEKEIIAHKVSLTDLRTEYSNRIRSFDNIFVRKELKNSADSSHTLREVVQAGKYMLEITIDKKITTLPSLPDFPAVTPVWSADGKYIAYASSHDLYVYNVETANLQTYSFQTLHPNQKIVQPLEVLLSFHPVQNLIFFAYDTNALDQYYGHLIDVETKHVLTSRALTSAEYSYDGPRVEDFPWSIPDFFCINSGVVSSFEDVPLNHPYGKAIAYGKKLKIISGYPDGLFRPDITINRAEFTKIVIETVRKQLDVEACLKEVQHDLFSDVPENQWFTIPICIAKNNGIVAGYPNGKFHPELPIKFVEAAKILHISLGSTGQDVSGSEPWYEPHVDYLHSRNAIPESIVSLDQNISRGEMIEMIYRLSSEQIEPISPCEVITFTVYFPHNDVSASPLPVERTVVKTPRIAHHALETLFLGPTEKEFSDLDVSGFGLNSLKNSFLGVSIHSSYPHPQSHEIVKNVAVVKFNQYSQHSIVDSHWSRSNRAAIEATLREFPTIENIFYMIGDNILYFE